MAEGEPSHSQIDKISYLAWSSVICVAAAGFLVAIGFPSFYLVAVFVISGFVLAILTIINAKKNQVRMYFIVGLVALVACLPLVGHVILFSFVLSNVKFIG